MGDVDGANARLELAEEVPFDGFVIELVVEDLQGVDEVTVVVL